MLIKTVHVKNFRSILDATLECDDLTALVGPNGAGKSTFLRALEVFYAPTPKIGLEDFYAEDTSSSIEITVTYHALDAEEEGLFQPYMNGVSLAVTRVLTWDGQRLSHSWHGSTQQHPAFEIVRGTGGAVELRKKYDEVRTANPEYADLPKVGSKDAALKALTDWEAAHPDKCQLMRDDGQFFGFAGVAKGYLGRHTRFIFVPAVRDAAGDAAEGRGGVFSELMDLVVRSVLAEKSEIIKLREETQQKYNEIMDPARLTELTELQNGLSATLRTYVPSSQVMLNWGAANEISIPLPVAEIKLEEDGYRSAVQRTGHGLQRAFVLTMLQHLAVARRRQEAQEDAAPPETANPTDPADGLAPAAVAKPLSLPDIVLGIEEPELYQHPARQRHIARMLLQLATGLIPGVAKKTQIVYCTHSPLFVGLDRFDQVRLLHKYPVGADKPKATGLVNARLDVVAEQLWTAHGAKGPKYTGASLTPRLQALMTPWMNEGFFARLVVLVEGEGDRAAILGVAASHGHDLEQMEIAVIPCMGKTNLDRPALIFKQLGLGVYLVWDSDKGGEDPKVETNRCLLRLLGQPEVDFPLAVAPLYACFEKDLETTLKTELTPDVYDVLLNEEQALWGMTREQARKNPVVVQNLVTRAKAKGARAPTLESIIDHVVMAANR